MALKTIVDEMSNALEDGITVKLHGFGKFKPDHSAIRGMPWLSEESKNKQHWTVRFYPSKLLKGLINNE